MLAFGACSDDGDAPVTSAAPATDPDLVASPFRVEAPGGLVPAGEGRGAYPQFWGDDSSGNHGPSVVLAPDASSAGPDDVTVVTASGFEGYQGGVAQASASYTLPHETLEIHGRPALFSVASPSSGRSVSELLVERGDDLALVIRSPEASLTS